MRYPWGMTKPKVVTFSELPIGKLFYYAAQVDSDHEGKRDLFMKIGPAAPKGVLLKNAPTNCRCLSGSRAGHHITCGAKALAVPVTVNFQMRNRKVND